MDVYNKLHGHVLHQVPMNIEPNGAVALVRCRRGLGHGSSDRGAAVGRDGEDCGGQMKEGVAE